MWSLFTLAAAGADPELATIRDEIDAYYLFDSQRVDLATRWFRSKMEQEPDEARWLLGYLRTLGSHPELRHVALLESVVRWTERHPQAGEGPVLLAHAAALEAMSPGRSSRQPWPEAPGPWCGEALSYLATLPEDPVLKYRQLSLRVRLGKTCRSQIEPDEAAMTALGMSGEAGPYARAWVGLHDEDPQGDVEAVEAVIEQEPWHLADLKAYLSRPEVAEVLLEAAHAAATSDRPVLVDGAIDVFRQAEMRAEALEASRRLAELDPDHPFAGDWIHELQQPPLQTPSSPEEPDPTTLLDPASRLETLRRSGPSSRRSWDRATHWQAVADAAHSVGETELQWEALRKLARTSWGSPHEQLVRLAIETGEVPRAAMRAAHALVRDRRSPTAPSAHEPDPGAQWRQRLAEALTLRAQLYELQGTPSMARHDLEEAMLLGGATAERQLHLGELYAQEGQQGEAIAQLAAGLARAGEGGEQQRARLDGLLSVSPWWVPEPELLIEASLPPPDAPQKVLDSTLFTDLQVTVDGAPMRLLDLPGAIVVDVWATWCGPCKESLPHLDQLARAYRGQVTFVAVSVDEDAAAAGRYLAARGGGAFVSAHVPGGMAALGVSGIPAMFVFNEEHELVATMSGWGPGDRRLDDAVRAVAPR
jgi:thiol-disulfide isomerase/thioredoxin